MTFAELIAMVREDDLDDVTDGCDPTSEELERRYRWTTAFLLRAAGEAQREACRRGACTLIYDPTLTIQLVAGASAYELDPAILRLERAVWTSLSGAKLLEKTSEASLDSLEPQAWRRAAAGEPSRYFVHGRVLYLDRAPTAEAVAQDATLNLQAYRLPMNDVALGEDLEIPDVHQASLRHWIVYRALSRPDEDEQHQKSALLHRELFDLHFGKPVEAGTLEYQIGSVGMTQHLPAVPYNRSSRRTSAWLRELG